MSERRPNAGAATGGDETAAVDRTPLWHSLAAGGAVSLVALPLYLHGLVPLDEGLAVHVADRLARGEVLYRDVATGVGPGLYYLLAAFYLVAPPTLELARVFQMLLLGVETALVHRIALRVAPPRFALLGAALFAGVSLFPYRYPNYSPVAVLFQLAGVLALLRFARSGARTTLLGAGALLGLCALTKQNYGVFALAGAGFALALLRFQRESPAAATWSRRRLVAALRGTFGDGLVLGAGAAIPGVVTLGALGFAGALPMLWQYSVTGVLEGTTAAFTKPYPLLDARAPFFFVDDAANYAPFPPATELFAFRTWRPFLVPAVLGAYLLPVAVILLQAARLAGGLARRRASVATCVLVPAAALFLLGVLPRADYFHLTLVVALVWVLIADVVARLPRLARATAVAASLLFAAGSAAAPYAQVLLDTTERLDTPLRLARAPWLRAKEAEARGLQAAVGWLEETTMPDEPTLVVPRDPLVYFLADRRNASPFPLTLPGAYDRQVFADALAQVDVVLARDTGHDELPLYRLMPEIHDLLRRGFEVDPRYLDRLQIPDGPPPEMQPLYALRRRATPLREPIPAAQLELIEALVAAPPTILNPDAGAFLASSREEPRLIRAQWLHEPALLLRPPSGGQKFAVAVRARPAAGDELRFQLALRPPQRRERERGADGALVEVLAWDETARTVARLHLEALDARERGVWRWRPIAVPLDAFAGRQVVLVIAASPGPSLLEVGDEVLVTAPRLWSAGDRGAAPVSDDAGALPTAVAIPGLPRAAIDALARFDDPAPFAAALAHAAGLPAARRGRIHLALGLALARSGDLPAARSEVERARALAPTDLEAHLAAAELAAAAGDGEAALRLYGEVLARAPGHRRALAMSALFELGRGDLQRAALLADGLAGEAAGYDELLVVARVRHAAGDVVGAATALLEAAASPGDTSTALDLLNQWFVGEVARLGQALLSRQRQPLPDAGFAGEVRVEEPPLPRAAPGQPLRFEVVVHNRSAHVWPALGNEDGGLRLAVGLRWRDVATGVLRDAGRRPLPHDLESGEEARLDLRLAAPGEAGDHVLQLDLVQEGIAWLGERGGRAAEIPITVVAPAAVSGGLP